MLIVIDNFHTVNHTAGNRWDICEHSGRGALGCGPQETFRGCSDISIMPKLHYPIH